VNFSRPGSAALFLVLLVSASGFGESRIPPQAVLDAAIDAWSIPGIAATVIDAEGKAWTGTSGIAATGEPVTTRTRFDIGSITKTFTSALVLDLVEDGVLSLDDPLSSRVPQFPRAEEIRIRHLLNHTSGIRDTFEHPRFLPSLLGDMRKRWTPEDSFTLLGEPEWDPGERFHYANPNYLLLGLIIEKATGRSVAELIAEKLTGPLDLENTFFRTGEEPLSRRDAHPFIDIDGDGSPNDLGAGPMTSFISSAWTAGAMASTSDELARWGRAYLTGALVSSDLRREMFEGVDRPNGWKYGLGVAFRPHRDGWLAGHAGNGAGYSATLWHDPEGSITVAVLTNHHLFDANAVADLLLDGALSRPVQLPEPGDRTKAGAPAGPEIAEAFFEGALEQIREGNYRKAIEGLKRALEADPSNGIYHRTLGEAALAACRGASMMDAYQFAQIARTALETAIEIESSDIEARMILMRFHLHVPPIAGGDPSKARQQAEAIAELDPESGARARKEIRDAERKN
jgi:D-alanyl-D-alanine carboxypeptidase